MILGPRGEAFLLLVDDPHKLRIGVLGDVHITAWKCEKGWKRYGKPSKNSDFMGFTYEKW